jgi:hypothetical protein
VLTTIGWIISYKVGISGLKYQFKKEEYYKIKEAFSNINDLFLKFFEYVYEFINISRNLYTTSGDFTEYELSVFSANKMLKLNYIFNLINIEFPEISFNKDTILMNSNSIDEYYTNLRNINDVKNVEKFIEFTTEVSNIIHTLWLQTNDLSIQMNNVIQKRFEKYNLNKK